MPLYGQSAKTLICEAEGIYEGGSARKALGTNR